MNNIDDKTLVSTLNRRTFVKWGATVSGAAALSVNSLPLKATTPPVVDAPSAEPRTVWSACTVNCGSRCAPASSCQGWCHCLHNH